MTFPTSAMHFFSMTFRLSLLMAVVCIALSSCSKLFLPAEAEKYRTRTKRKRS